MDVWVCLRKEHVGIENVCVYFTAVVWSAVLSHRCAPCPGLSGTVNAKIYFWTYDPHPSSWLPLPSTYVPRDLVRRRDRVSLAGPVITSTGIGASVRQCGCFMICRPEGPLCALAVISSRVGGAILRAIPHKNVATLAHTCIHQMLNFAVPAALWIQSNSIFRDLALPTHMWNVHGYVCSILQCRITGLILRFQLINSLMHVFRRLQRFQHPLQHFKALACFRELC